MFNFGQFNISASYSTLFSFWKPTENLNDRIILMQPTSCTDYLTDWLMYPNRCPLENIREPITTDKTRIIVAFKSEYDRANFISYGLPLLHKIEKANKFKLTTYELYGNLVLIFTGSKLWQQSTFALSLYLKIIRNTCLFNRKIKSYRDYFQQIGKKDPVLNDDFLAKIMFKGFITKVNRGCKYKHGWLQLKQGSHSNNGIYYTINAWGIHNKFIRTDSYTINLINTSFLRISNLKEIYDKTEKVNLNALRFL